MQITEMITALKKVLPYKESWYAKLTNAQIFRIYQKYVLKR